MKENRLYRVVNGKVIAGVAGGIAEYFGIDPTIIRIIFILLTIFGGGGVLIYIVLWIVVPEKYTLYPPFGNYSGSSTAYGNTTGVGETYEGYEFGKPAQPLNPEPEAQKSRIDGGLIAGLVLILIGAFFLFEKFIPQLSFGDFWPLLLVLVGVLMIVKGFPLVSRKEDPSINNRTDKDNTTNNDLNL